MPLTNKKFSIPLYRTGKISEKIILCLTIVAIGVMMTSIHGIKLI